MSAPRSIDLLHGVEYMDVSRDEVARHFVEGTYERTPAFDKFFEYVDGFKDPAALIYRDWRHLSEEERLCFDEELLSKVRSRNKGLVSRAIAGAWNDTRSLSHVSGFDIRHNYCSLFYVDEMVGVVGLLRWYASGLDEKRPVSVLDWGAGRCFAFNGLLKNSVVCPDTSAAMTLPTGYDVVCSSPNVVFANSAFTAPRVGVSFDAVLSAYGGISYHPFERDYAGQSIRFGVLHALNFIKNGGLLFQACNYEARHAYYPLIESGVLELINPDELGLGKRQRSTWATNKAAGMVFKVLRKMSYQEMLTYLAEEGGEVTNVLSLLERSGLQN